MRKIAVVVALVSSSIACGGFLGFGDDDDEPLPPPRPAVDAGSNVTADAADGGSEVAPLPPGCQRHAFRAKGATDVDAALASAGWQSGQRGTATMEIANGELVLRTPGTPLDEANVSFRRDGIITRVTCTTTVEVSSFSGQSRFVQMRLVGSEWGNDNYYVWSEWRPEGLISGVQANPVLDSGTVEAYSPLQASPATNQKLALAFELTAEPPKFVANLGGKEMTVIPQRPPGAVDYARVIVGLDTSSPGDGGFSTIFDDIECITCVAQ